MAHSIRLQHRDSGIVKTGYYGFSWTTFCFGSLPALFRGDFITFIGLFVVCVLIGFLTAGIGLFFVGFVWAFFYNGYYTRRLLERGYHFADTAHNTADASARLGVAPAMLPASATLS